MAVTKTPEGTTIIHALATARVLARRIADMHFATRGMRQMARGFETAYADGKQAVIGLEGQERRVSHDEMSDAIVDSLREMAQAGLIDGLQDHHAFPSATSPGGRSVTVAGEIDLNNLVFLIQQKLRKDAA